MASIEPAHYTYRNMFVNKFTGTCSQTREKYALEETHVRKAINNGKSYLYPPVKLNTTPPPPKSYLYPPVKLNTTPPPPPPPPLHAMNVVNRRPASSMKQSDVSTVQCQIHLTLKLGYLNIVMLRHILLMVTYFTQ